MKLKKMETGLPIKVKEKEEGYICNFKYNNLESDDLEKTICILKANTSNLSKLCAGENYILMRIFNLLGERKQIEDLIRYGPKPVGLC